MKKNRVLAALLWLMLAAILLASPALLLGGRLHLVNGEAHEMLERYAKLEAARSVIAENYYQEVDEAALLDGAMRGMLASLGDPYSFYYSPEEMQAWDADMEGAYDGVGLLILEESSGALEVLRVYSGSPAESAGMKAGDRIIAVDGASVLEADLLERMRGENGTQVQLSIDRGGERLEISVERANVRYSNVASAMLEGGIGYIAIFQFSGDDVEAFARVLEELQQAGASALIIDLRNNPGGLLGDATAIADQLLDGGLIVYTEDRSGAREVFYAEAGACELPLAVLVNGSSASASEILAAAVQERGRGAVVGTQTYGKGVVQSLVSFESDGSGMQYTSSRYFTPNGRSIHGEGVAPDVVAEAGEDWRCPSGVPDLQNDDQLRAAQLLMHNGQVSVQQ